MSLEPVQVCVYCAALIQGDVLGLDPRPQATIESLRETSKFCVMCKIFLDSNTAYSRKICEEFQEVKETDIEKLPINVKVEGLQKSESGLMWATLKSTLDLDSQGFS